ncbi:MAG: hypothetical protein NXH75_17325 [Halobacteriovoraceae bacterium]|nr:hypothetical protein [Halobacteriovoraceae bacterium]
MLLISLSESYYSYMNIIKGNSPELENSLIQHLLKEKLISNLLIPAGGTPIEFYRVLREEFSQEFRSFSFWQIDDVLNGANKNCFYDFFKEHLGDYLPQLNSISGSFLGFDKPFSSFLGLGMNGHVAFHEPHIPRNFSFGCVELGPETLEYLSLAPDTWGITYGLGTFLKGEAIYLMVKGEHKREILKRFLADDRSVPAVALKKHPNLYLLVDEALGDLF